MIINLSKKYTFILLCFFTQTLFAQKNAKELLQQAESYYENNKYEKALGYFTSALQTSTLSLEQQKKMAICYFQVGNTAEASRYLNYVFAESKKTDPEIILYIARCYHDNLEFGEAIRWYKKYLTITSRKSDDRARIKADIMRCAKGQKIKNLSSDNFVQNLGEEVNSSGDDFAPIPSPNSEDKIYFSSAREISLGGLRNEEGIRDEKKGNYFCDIFSTKLENGAWGDVRPLSYLLNSARHDVALDFSSDGQQMYYFRSTNLFSGNIFVDTFKTFEERNLVASPFKSPLIAEEGDGTPFFVNDTLMLFSSRRNGGFGGSDLYYSIFQNGKWQNPLNFGKEINSPFDEICPFLATDGRTLFFSSNNLESIGGYDIFVSEFSDDSLQWSKARNLELPINSARDDAFFRLNFDGTKAFFSSNRKDGFGKRDLYSIFFKSAIEAQTINSTPDLFYKVKEFRDSIDSFENPNKKETPTIVYNLKSINYDKEVDILSNKNQQTLNNILAILRKNPDTKVRLTSHVEANAGTGLDAFLSIKRAEKIVDFLAKEGIGFERIKLLGCGAMYPVAQNSIEGTPSQLGQKLNRRIEVAFYKLDKSIKINFETNEVPDYLQSGEFFRFKNIDKGLSYRVEIAAIKQIYNGDLIERYPDILIERNAEDNIYHYSIGLFTKYQQAEKLQQELIQLGVNNATVVPYIEGFKLNEEEIKNNIPQYPDLQNFVNRKK